MEKKINHSDLAQQISTMSTRSKLYKTLKAALLERGWWKNRPRGKHEKGRMNNNK